MIKKLRDIRRGDLIAKDEKLEWFYVTRIVVKGNSAALILSRNNEQTVESHNADSQVFVRN